MRLPLRCEFSLVWVSSVQFLWNTFIPQLNVIYVRFTQQFFDPTNTILQFYSILSLYRLMVISNGRYHYLPNSSSSSSKPHFALRSRINKPEYPWNMSPVRSFSLCLSSGTGRQQNLTMIVLFNLFTTWSGKRKTLYNSSPDTYLTLYFAEILLWLLLFYVQTFPSWRLY